EVSESDKQAKERDATKTLHPPCSLQCATHNPPKAIPNTFEDASKYAQDKTTQSNQESDKIDKAKAQLGVTSEAGPSHRRREEPRSTKLIITNANFNIINPPPAPHERDALGVRSKDDEELEPQHGLGEGKGKGKERATPDIRDLDQHFEDSSNILSFLSDLLRRVGNEAHNLQSSRGSRIDSQRMAAKFLDENPEIVEAFKRFIAREKSLNTSPHQPNQSSQQYTAPNSSDGPSASTHGMEEAPKLSKQDSVASLIGSHDSVHPYLQDGPCTPIEPQVPKLPRVPSLIGSHDSVWTYIRDSPTRPTAQQAIARSISCASLIGSHDSVHQYLQDPTASSLSDKASSKLDGGLSPVESDDYVLKVSE
ncbi:hypothetical protein CVT24_007393, partial [Panaeolus cyanescens]